MGISFKMGKGSVCGVYTSLKPMIHFDSKQSQSIFNQNYYKNAMANNCKQCSIRIISHTTTLLPKAYDCVAVYIAGRRTSLVVYGWWPQPPTKKQSEFDMSIIYIYPYIYIYKESTRCQVCQYRYSHGETILLQSYLHSDISYSSKIWIRYRQNSRMRH